MSKPRVKIQANIDTNAHAQTILSNVQSQLAGKNVFSTDFFSRGLNDAGQVQIVAEFRFNNSVDRDTIKDWIRDQIDNHPVVKTWILSAKLTWHLCTHDNAQPTPCNQSQYFEYVK